MTCIVYIQDNLGWMVGFGVPVVVMIFSALSFFLASPFYVKLKPKASWIPGLAQVVMAFFRNRSIKLSTQATVEVRYHTKGSMLLGSSERLTRSSRRSKSIDQGNPNMVSRNVDVCEWKLQSRKDFQTILKPDCTFLQCGYCHFLASVDYLRLSILLDRTKLPKSMSSLASTLYGIGMSAANLVSSSIVSTVRDFTQEEGQGSWVASNINKGHYDYCYWLLACMSFVNFIYYLVCSKSYDPCEEEEESIIADEGFGR
ncbi:unnamed protein product [Dovyalis caffra]|uniref:Uncharacterized protein n=1 Tax=Dovyalis caffra TaxID=77055 RepID=A0AAV1SK97_9ROSI|nr:unnamed protein product [Dovyalis caffra]